MLASSGAQLPTFHVQHGDVDRARSVDVRVGGEDGGGLEHGGLRRELELELLVPAGGGR